MTQRWLMPLVLCCACGGAATPQPAPSPPAAANEAKTQQPHGAPFLSTLDADAPNVGRIEHGGQNLDESQLLEIMLQADLVYLGEKHDNPDHHRLQARVLGALLERGARPSLVFEMVDEPQQPLLDELRSRRADAEELGRALDWERSGWPDFSMYAPIFALGLRYELPLLAAGVPRSTLKQLAFGQLAGAADLQRFGLDRPMPAPLMTALTEELVSVHCGMLPAQALAPMAHAQRARDFVLATRAAQAASTARGPRSVVVAGNGHTRTDRGAPWVARERSPGLRQFSLAFMEVGREAGPAPYDAIWYTPRANDEDPCASHGAAR